MLFCYSEHKSEVQIRVKHYSQSSLNVHKSTPGDQKSTKIIQYYSQNNHNLGHNTPNDQRYD